MKMKISEVADLLRGVSYKKSEAKEASDNEDDVLVLRGGNIQDGKIFRNANDEVFVDKTLISDKQFLRKGDVVIVGSTGSSNLIGKAAIIDEDYDNISFGAFLMLIRPKNTIHSKYFDYFFLSSEYRNAIRELSVGVNINNIRKEYIENLEINCPPPSEQVRIVAKLDSLFAHLELTKQSLEKIPVLLKQFRQTVLTQAVTGKLTEEWREWKEFENVNDWIINIIDERKKDPDSIISTKISFKEVTGQIVIPKTWEFGSLQYFGEFTRGKSKHRPRNDKKLFGGPYPFVQTGEVSRSKGLITIYTNTYSEFGLSQSRLFPRGTLCITIAANIAETGILNFDACFPDSVVGYIPYKDYYTSKFAMYCIMTMQKDLEHYAPSTAQKNINLGILFDVPFPVPPKVEQTEIVRRVEALFSKADAIEAQYKKLKEQVDQLPQAILTKAFKGELVEQLESDRDVKDLLEEIKMLKLNDKKKGK